MPPAPRPVARRLALALAAIFALVVGGATVALLVLGELDDPHEVHVSPAAPDAGPPTTTDAGVEPRQPVAVVDAGLRDDDEETHEDGDADRPRRRRTRRTARRPEPRPATTTTTTRSASRLVELTAVTDQSKRPLGDLAGELKKKLTSAVKSKGGGRVELTKVGAREGLLVAAQVRKVSIKRAPSMTTVEIECGMTVSAAPSGGLRFASTARAAAAIDGRASGAEERELAADALTACATSLAGDLVKK